jgi:hypothetical protein
MAKSEACYGTPEYYAELFSDILADVATGIPEEDKQTIVNVMAGFEQAIIRWMKYHEDSITRYRELHRLFLLGEFALNDAQ